jgi:TRAP-type mannitol/chloroaromatic compound transport system permease small subunit
MRPKNIPAVVMFVIAAAWFIFLRIADQENIIQLSSRTGGTLLSVGGLLIVIGFILLIIGSIQTEGKIKSESSVSANQNIRGP